MTTKYLGSAILYTVLTVAYYVWMVPKWINLDCHNDEVESPKQTKDNYPQENGQRIIEPDYDPTCDSKQKVKFNKKYFKNGSRKSGMKIATEPRGEKPPSYAFCILTTWRKCDSFLRINTSRDASYVVKLVNADDGETIMEYYLPAGISKEIKIPSGTFEIRYTAGTEWFGYGELFGDSGTYAKADRLFTFSEGSGYELTLYSVRNGNLHTSKIRKEDF